MKISKIDFRNLRDDTRFQFHAEFRNLVATHGSVALKSIYLPLYEMVDESLKKNKQGELDKTYNVLALRINALILIEDVAVHEPFIRAFNAVVAKYAVNHHNNHTQ